MFLVTRDDQSQVFGIFWKGVNVLAYSQFGTAEDGQWPTTEMYSAIPKKNEVP